MTISITLTTLAFLTIILQKMFWLALLACCPVASLAILILTWLTIFSVCQVEFIRAEGADIQVTVNAILGRTGVARRKCY